jgi:hypothetical protein
MPEPAPVILYNPDLSIDGVSLKCLMSHIELTPDVTTIEVKTSCGIKEYPGSVKWTLKASLYHSYDPAGTNAVLEAAVLAAVPVPFTVTPSSSNPVSATNPEYVGELIPQPFTPLSGDVGDASSFDLEWSISGWTLVPEQNITPVAGTFGGFAPADHTVAEVEEYAAAHPRERAAVVAAERAGKNRATLISSLESLTEAEAETVGV